MTALKLELRDNCTAFEPGAELTGTIQWQAEKTLERLELRLFWFTRGKGTEDAGIVAKLDFEQPMAQETRSFQMRLPEAPYSFSGKLISLVWGLELIAYPTKEVCRQELEMGPGKREIRLDTVPDPTRAHGGVAVWRQ